VGLGLSLVNESTVSRHHAEVTRTGDAVTVKDLGSTNGTYVNGVKLDGERTLSPGDYVQFGAVKLRYEA
jgi:pSer/pThr/pTyr-binding forkhead associated (FHA) protein